MQKYEDFVYTKDSSRSGDGLMYKYKCSKLFDFQESLVAWALGKGRAAVFADCGLGKTPMQLAWADNVVRQTGKSVLILTPLAVSSQTVREGEKFGVQCERNMTGIIKSKGIIVANYEKLHFFNPGDYSGVVCDESSILKSFTGSRKKHITDFMLKIPYRLLCTATASPNDYIELGTSSEALGNLGYMDMLGKFFKNESNDSGLKSHFGEAPKWRFRGHAEIPFWKWVTSWSRACRKPLDLGFDDKKFILPKLVVNNHMVERTTVQEGMLFNIPAGNLFTQRREKRETMEERCDKVVELTHGGGSHIVWCQLNDEGNMLEKMIPGSIQISGKDSDDSKEKKFLSFIDKSSRILITKAKIGAWGLNFQHCNHMTYFPSHSYEQYYQAVRRCWRFGQKNTVTVDVVLTEGERRILNNMEKKSELADRMFTNMVTVMNDSINHNKQNDHTKKVEVPSWV